MLFQLAAILFIFLTPFVAYYLYDDMSWKAQNRIWIEQQLRLIQLHQALIIATLKEKGIIVQNAR